jgi:hypothetical protein
MVASHSVMGHIYPWGYGPNLSMGLRRILIAEHNFRIFINTFLNLSKCLVPLFKKKPVASVQRLTCLYLGSFETFHVRNTKVCNVRVDGICCNH